jgi:hypothetical protein
MADQSMPVIEALEREDDRKELVERLASSVVFQRAHRLRAFFLYVSRCALENRPDEATEQQIGVHVFEREPGYNPNDDNIVRAQARLLRMKLEHYFAHEGKDDPYLITIPKGQYLPTFEPKVPKLTVLPVTPEPTPSVSRRRSVIPLVACALILIASGIALWLRSSNSHRQKLPDGFVSFWSALLPSDSSTLVIASDHTYGLLQEAAGHDISLSQYLSAGYWEETGRIARESGFARISEEFNQRHLTGLYDITSVLRVAGLDEFRQARVNVRYARDVNLRDLSSGNVILIGSRHTNPWAGLFDRDLRFGCDYDYGAMDGYYVNRSPRSGEQPLYRPTKTGSERITYGGVAFFTSEKGHRVLIISGTSGVGVEMAAEFLTDPGSSAKLMNQVYSPSQGVRPFELILRTVSLSGQQASRPEILLRR